MRYLLFFTSLFVIAACQPLPPPDLEPPEAPLSYVTERPQTTLTVQDRWWQDFNDERLNRLQERLFSNNLSLQQAIHRLEQLETLQRISRAQRLPQVSGNASVGRSQSLNATGGSIATTQNLSLAAGYEVDLWSKLKAEEQAAEFRSKAGQAEVEALLLSLSAQLSEQYFLAVEQRAQLDLLERQTINSRELLQLITARYRAGLATISELYQARQNLATMAAQEPTYRAALIQAENSIALLLGELPRSLSVELRQLPQISPVIDPGLPASLLTRRPDIAAALLELQASDRDLAAALAERLPSLNLSAGIGRSVTRLAHGDYGGTLWNLTLGLLQPLYDGGRLKALSDQQMAARAEQLALSREKLLSAVEEVESALTAELQAAEAAALLEQRRQINQAGLDVLRHNYLAGLTDSSDLLNRQIDHLEILSQQVSNRRQWLSHRITLVRALGGTWMTDELQKQRQALTTK
ncbi:MAG: efflux transporter outer membrane subunit [Desulfuromonadales bacterium]|nr:efflux transporter outer membrane subunit [Desulfuromonadales bacterium]MBN2792854.1 efflux transporter outer membrane subunit [Desulfuromonadales bacterium]